MGNSNSTNPPNRRSCPAIEDIASPAVQQRLQQALRRVNVVRPSVAFIGCRGVGKSTLINSLRGLRAFDQQAVAVGADETTVQVTRIDWNGLRLVDVPGAEGNAAPEMMGSAYIEKHNLHKFDAVIFLYTSVFSRSAANCATILHSLQTSVPVFVVRNKVGSDCRNDVRNRNARDLTVAFERMKERARDQMRTTECAHLANDEYLFLIEADYDDAVLVDPPVEMFQRDFHRLRAALVTNVRDDLRRRHIAAILNRQSGTLAELRARECSALIPLYSGWAAATGAIPLPGASQVGALAIARRAVTEFVRLFVLDSSRGKEWDAAAFLRHLLAHALNYFVASALVGSALAESSVLIPAIGVPVNMTIGATISFTMMRQFLENLIQRLKGMAQRLYTMSFEPEGEMFLTDVGGFVRDAF